MCGIIGYCGQEQAPALLLRGLKDLEYRGYDSAGLSVFAPTGLQIVKTAGRVADVEEKWDRQKPKGDIFCGIGHTRWATHGAPTERNAHPHRAGQVCIVHNGIIENADSLRAEFAAKGYPLLSDTDSEILAVLLDAAYARTGEALSAIRYARSRVVGSYACAALFADQRDVVYAFRKDSPLIAAKTQIGNFLASDFFAVSRYGERYMIPEEDEVVVLTKEELLICKENGERVEKPVYTVQPDSRDTGKGIFEHYMLKEIFDAPDAVRKTCEAYMRDGLPDFQAFDTQNLRFQASRIGIVACGTALNAGKLGRYFFETFAGLPVFCEIASEFRYYTPPLFPGDLLIFITQSGETADTLAAMREAKKRGVPTLAVVNTPNSAAAREADCVLYTHAGTETAVASTKAYIAQAALLYMLANEIASQKGRLSQAVVRENMRQLDSRLPVGMANILADCGTIQALSDVYCADNTSCFFIGRGDDYDLAEESALKLKEVSYIHCEAYAAGELKHGTIALIAPHVPVIAIASGERTYEKTVSNLREVRARGARVLLVTDRNPSAELAAIADDVYTIPLRGDLFALCAAVFFQLFAYYGALRRGCDVDKPRNLAKSVTVE